MNFILIIMKFLFVMIFCTVVSGKAPLHKKKNRISGSYIVSFKDNSDVKSSTANIKSLLSRSGKAKVNREYSKAFKGFSATLSEKDLEMIRRLDFVDYVEEDETISVFDSVPWGLDRIDNHELLFDNFYFAKGFGTDVDVYVLDTGIRTSHDFFGGRAFTNSDMDFISPNNNGVDCDGHGTHVAGIIAQVASKAKIYGIRVLDCKGDGTTSSLLAGMEYVQNLRDSKLKVVCMSLGGDSSGVIDNAVAEMFNSGVPVIVAAGNKHGDSCRYSPAGASQAYTVGATDRSDHVPLFSNFGKCVNIFAPGANILSASHTSDSGHVFMSGTSMAAPFVAGAAAIECNHLELDNCDPTKVYEALTNNATPNKIIGLDSSSPNLIVYV